jgi:hypothetical protein
MCLKHYGAVALPCRVRDPDRKGKVESGVGHAQKTPLKGLRFESLEEAQRIWIAGKSAGPTRAFTAPPSGKWRPCSPKRNRRCCRCRRAVSLLPVRRAHRASGWLRRSRSRLLRRAAGLDRTPCSRAVECHACALLDPLTGQLLREHLRQQQRAAIASRRGSPTANSTVHATATGRAEKSPGRTSGAVPEHASQSGRGSGAPHPGRALAWPKKYGVASTDDACAWGWKRGCEYHFVRRYLEHNPQLPLSLRQVDPLIRQLTLYRDLIENRTGQETNS